ncbi:MAG: hypothetical protein JHC33_10170 [Ignisphaera sp.]|nr:hypothetical protein [Ignisphaera sp.]
MFKQQLAKQPANLQDLAVVKNCKRKMFTQTEVVELDTLHIATRTKRA